MASEGLFPQLIVIPLHRDHGVITMAAGKNDVIKLLPPLTLSEEEAHSFLSALDAVLGRVPRQRQQEPCRSCATSPRRRCAAARAPSAGEPGAPSGGWPVGASREDVCLVTGASGFIGGRLRGGLCARAMRCAASCVASSDTSRLQQLDVQIAVGDLTDRALARRAPRTVVSTCCTAARSCRTGPPRRRSPASTSTARATCSTPASGRR